MNESEAQALNLWLNRVATELDCPVEGIALDDLLAVARDVAHNQIRPGAPTSTFFIGYAMGMWEQALTDGGMAPRADDREAKLHKLSQQIQKLSTEPAL